MSLIPPEIIERLKHLPIEDVAERLGISVIRHKAKCFMHDDRHPSLSFGKNGYRWKCFVCDKGGANAISLVMAFNEYDFKQACEWLCSAYGIYYTSTNQTYPRIKRIPQSRIRQSNCTQKEHLFSTKITHWIIEHAKLSTESQRFLFDERQLDRNVIAQLKVGSISDANLLLKYLQQMFSIEILLESGLVKQTNSRLYLTLFTPCLLFPYFDETGVLVGLQSRYLGNNPKAPKFQFISNQKSHFFNLAIINKLKHGDHLYIAEGITDCLALLSAGFPAVAVPSATTIPIEDLRKLKEYNLYMFPDNDESGEHGFHEIRTKLINMGKTLHRSQLPTEYKDFSQYYIAIKKNERRNK